MREEIVEVFLTSGKGSKVLEIPQCGPRCRDKEFFPPACIPLLPEN
jgi:hypothetical protein